MIGNQRKMHENKCSATDMPADVPSLLGWGLGYETSDYTTSFVNSMVER